MTCGRHAPDGSPIEFYALSFPEGEPAIIHGAVPEGAEILELGCGAGRVTHALLELGHAVVAVDQSPEMLENIQGAERVLANIETLELGRTFPAVVLMSHLVNVPDNRRRSAYLQTCRRHAEGSGVVVIEQTDPGWLRSPPVESVSERSGMRFLLRHPRLEGRLLSAVMHYQSGDREWVQPFTTQILDEGEMEDALAQAGLRLRSWLDARHVWLAAGPE